MGKQAFITKDIDGESFSIYYLPPRISVKLLIKIIKVIGPAIGKAFPESGSDFKLKDILDININIGSAIDTLIDRFDENEVQYIIDVLINYISHKGQGRLDNEASYNELFSGNLSLLFKVIGKALEVQYADFFKGNFVPKEMFQSMTEQRKEEKEKNSMIQEK